MLRRKLLCAAALATPAAMIAACSKPLNTVITVNLANAQAEAVTIETALKAVYEDVSATLSATIQNQAAAMLQDLDAAVKAFTSLPSGTTTYAAFANAVLGVINPLVALLPLPPATKAAITTGTLLISGLINGLASVSLPPPSAAVGVSAVRIIPGPVPVPLG